MGEIAIMPASGRRQSDGWNKRQAGFIPVLFSFTVPSNPTPEQVYHEAFIAMLSYGYEPKETTRLVAEITLPPQLRRAKAAKKYGFIPGAINRAAACARVSLAFTWGTPPGEMNVVVTEATAPSRIKYQRRNTDG